MAYMAKIAGLTVLAASWVGIAGCDNDKHSHRDRVIVVPTDRHDGHYYKRGERSRNERHYNIYRDGDHRGYHRQEYHHDHD